MPRRFYSSKKKKRRVKKQIEPSLEGFSQKIEGSSTKKDVTVVLGIFIFCFFLGAILAVILNTSTVSFLVQFGRLPTIKGFE